MKSIENQAERIAKKVDEFLKILHFFLTYAIKYLSILSDQ